MKVSASTMGNPKRPAGKSLYPLKPAIDAFLDLPLGSGFADFPDLIDKDFIENRSFSLGRFSTLKLSTSSLKKTGTTTFTLDFNSSLILEFLKCVDLKMEEELLRHSYLPILSSTSRSR
jgi:hypothetical protein